MNEVRKKSYRVPDDHMERTVIAYLEHTKKKSRSEWYFSEQKTRKTVIEIFEEDIVAEEGKKVVLLSTAGYGKTQELTALSGFYSNQERKLYPFRWILRDYQGKDIETLLQNKELNWRDIPRDRLLLIFDGLDELDEDMDSVFIKSLNSFCEDTPNANVIVSSRYNAYDIQQKSLREFDIYILQPLTTADIENYIEKKVGHQTQNFKRLLSKNKFIQYLDNPYYLTRLTRFFLEEPNRFPEKKTELFDQILFERIEKDTVIRNKRELKERLVTLAEKLAFCMTHSGKSSITDSELKKILPEQNDRLLVKSFSVLNCNELEQGKWSFEHKNLQEHLCAKLLSGLEFESLKLIISFPFNRSKLIPRFLNSIAFLFEAIEASSSLFQKLFNWLQETQPELFVRFEKEQIPKEKRHEIFKRILDYYKTRNITIRVSSNFSVEELSDFASLDKDLIEYLINLLIGLIPNETAYDIIELLDTYHKPFLCKELFEKGYFYVLDSPKYEGYVKGRCVTAVERLDPNDKFLFEKTLRSNINLYHYDIRRRLIEYLESTNFYEDYIDLMIETVDVYEEAKKNKQSIWLGDRLIPLLLKCSSAKSTKKILSLCLKRDYLLSRYYSGRHAVHFKEDEVDVLFENAIKNYPKEPRIACLVYKICVTIEGLLHEEKFVELFKKFFAATCGTQIIFSKFYKYAKRERNMLYFADSTSIDTIINDYREGRLSDDEAIMIRNRLSWKNQELSDYFLTEIAKIAGNKFEFEKDDTDYKALQALYSEKNQLFLLDRGMYLKEVEDIFTTLGKESVNFDDLHIYESKALRRYHHSRVREDISSCCSRNESLTKDDFIEDLKDGAEWEYYVASEVLEYFKSQNRPELKPELITKVGDWLKDMIRHTSFTEVVTDDPTGGIHSRNDVELFKQLYTHSDIQLDDDHLLKLLEVDFSGVSNTEEPRGLSSKIIENISDTEILHKKIIENLESGRLGSWVLVTHFKICNALHFTDCLKYLYLAIRENNYISDYEKRRLTDYYLNLGGDISDFSDLLKVPTIKKEHDHLSNWEWHLLEKSASIETEKVERLFEILIESDLEFDETRKAIIITLLKTGSKKGLQQWLNYVRNKRRLPFDHDLKDIAICIDANPTKETVDLLFEALDFSLENKIFHYRSFESIPQFIYATLNLIISKYPGLYPIISSKIKELIEKYKQESFVAQLYTSQESIDQKYFEGYQHKTSIEESIIEYDKCTS